jgi:hypothetical protein
MNWPAATAIAVMWIGAGIGAYGAAANEGSPVFFICAAICTYFVLVRMAGSASENDTKEDKK